MAKSTYFRITPIMYTLLGIIFGLLTLDNYRLGGFTHSLHGTTMLLNHLIMGCILVFIMIFTYLLSKKVKDKFIQDLRSSEERYRMIFDNSPLGIIHFDQNGKLTQCNDKFIEIIGSSREKLIGFNLLTELRDEKLKMAMESAVAGKVSYYEGIYTSVLSGKTLPLKAIVKRITSDEDQFLGGVTIFEDITEKKHIEREMARLDRLDLVGQISASIGHEIRNPMTTVRGFLQLLGNRETNLQKSEYYDIMISELDRANLIITEFLSLATNKLVKFESKNINEIIEMLYPLILVDALKQDKNLLFKKGIVPNIPLDEGEIRQLILNLARNGLDAMPKGKDLIVRTYTANGELVLAIQDEGSGISADVLDKIGTPFMTTKEKGTGLGLAVCYSIANRHDAKIVIKTNSSGTTFSVHFKVPNTNVKTKKVS